MTTIVSLEFEDFSDVGNKKTMVHRRISDRENALGEEFKGVNSG
jgi:hypothetical protein